jgi:alpha-glucosidase
MILRSFVLLAALGGATAASAGPRECLKSPGKVIELCTWVDGGQAWYEVSRKGVPVLAPSTMGLSFKDEEQARYSALSNPRRAAANATWEQPWGEQRVIRDDHTDLTVTIAGDTPLTKHFDVQFRLFDDGFGFRYSYNAIPAGQAVSVMADHTQFATVGAYQAWPGAGRISLHANRRAPDHARRDAADVARRQEWPLPLNPRGGSGRFPEHAA